MVEVKPLGAVQIVPINSVKPYGRNPRKIPAKAIEQCAESIRQFGWQQPLVVDDDMVLLAGHTRLQAAKSLKLTKVPVVVAHGLTPEQARAFRIADNRTHDYSTWDYPQLIAELEGLDADFAAVLDLADWRGIIDQFEEIQKDSELDLSDEASAFLTGDYTVTVLFGSKDAAEAAGATLAEIPGVVNVRYSH
jgi:ParB-like chromosome segregation protein Spo0J